MPSGVAIERSLQLLAPGGQFIELGRLGIWAPEQEAAVRPDVTYHVLDLPEVAEREPGVPASGCADRGDVRREHTAMRYRYFLHASHAFRMMAQGQHVGKLAVLVAQPSQAFTVSAEGNYLITGGRGGVGLALARWLVEQGARHLVLASRRAPDQEQLVLIDELVQAGAEVTNLEIDVSDADALASALPPLRGVIHAAGVLDDGPLVQQDRERMRVVLAPKVGGASALDRLTAGHELDFFILCSSAASVLGSAGQGAYAAANAYLDGLAALKRGRGETALSINWGPVADVGKAAQMAPRVRAQWAAAGIDLMPPAALGPAVMEASRIGLPQVVALAPIGKSFRMARSRIRCSLSCYRPCLTRTRRQANAPGRCRKPYVPRQRACWGCLRKAIFPWTCH